MSAKIAVTLDPENLEAVLRAAQLAADQLLVALADGNAGKQQVAMAAEFDLACAELLSDLAEARLAQ